MNNNLTTKQIKIKNSEALGMVNYLFNKFSVGTLLNRTNISKTKGASPLEIFTIIFNLPFVGKNIFHGIIKNKQVSIGKDAVYEFLNNSSYNWRRLNMLLVAKLYIIIRRLLDDSSEEVLIFDDSTYDRSRSKKVELLSRVFDHTFKKYL